MRVVDGLQILTLPDDPAHATHGDGAQQPGKKGLGHAGAALTKTPPHGRGFQPGRSHQRGDRAK